MADIEKMPMDDAERASHDQDVIGTQHEVPPPPVQFSELEVEKLYRKIDLRCARALSRRTDADFRAESCPS